MIAAFAAAALLSMLADEMVASVRSAYAQVAAAQSMLPPPASDRERLERLLDEDQAGRLALGRINLNALPADERNAAMGAAFAVITPHDLAAQAVLKPMIPSTGWFETGTWGEKAARAAFLIAQHATNDPDLMRLTLSRITPLVAAGEADPQEYALMSDRVALTFDHKPQRFGTQVGCSSGVWAPLNLEDPDQVDARRKALGLKTTEAQYLTLFAKQTCR